jgi:5-methylcytosine-specific restriction enzyme subunit McrC
LHAVFEQVCEPGALDFEEAWSALHYHRLNEHYRDAHALARLLLEAMGTRDVFSPGSTRSFVFMIDMNRLFERFVLRVVERALGGTACRVQYQAPDPSVIWDAGANRPYTRIVPDLTIVSARRPPRRLPVDAKYKLYDDRPLDPADLYQVFLYAYAYGHAESRAPAAVLLYPSETNAPRPTHLRIRTDAGPPGAQLVALGLPIQPILDELAAGRPGPRLSDLHALLLAILEPDLDRHPFGLRQ